MSALRRLLRARRGAAPPAWVPVATARQPEAEMLAELLNQEGVPAYVRMLDVSGMPASGACQVCVREDRVLEARAIVDPMAAGDGTWG